jgi:hypothetical protein
MGPIHPRDKKPVGDRLAQSAGVTVYGKPGAFTGPTISGCTVNAASNTVTVTFNASLLGADTVQVQSYPPPFNNVSASSLAVLVDPKGFCFQGNGRQCLDDGTGTAGANETDSGWVYVDIAESTANSITVDLTRSGGAIYGIRYAMVSFNANHPAHQKPTPQKHKPEPQPYHPLNPNQTGGRHLLPTLCAHVGTLPGGLLSVDGQDQPPPGEPVHGAYCGRQVRVHPATDLRRVRGACGAL